MIETFRFEAGRAVLDAITITRAAEAAVGRVLPDRVIIAHGANQVHAAVLRSDSGGHILPISERLAGTLGLAPGVSYRLSFSDGALTIGPVVGILVTGRSDRIDLSPGSFATFYLLRYSEVGGLVFLFATDGVDTSNRTIDGYYWLPDQDRSALSAIAGPSVWVGANAPRLARARSLAAVIGKRAAAEGRIPAIHPRTARFQAMASKFRSLTHPLDRGGRWSGSGALGEGRFVPGKLPFPAALWLRIDSIPEPVLTALREGASGRIFNSDLFDKAEGFRRLSVEPAVASHLPQTEALQSSGQVLEWLNRHGRIVLKRAGGQAGTGLMIISSSDDGYRLDASSDAPSEQYASFAALAARIDALTAGMPYLLQQCIDLPVVQDRRCDFRVMMQKDDAGEWRVRACFGRFGSKGRIVTNFINAGYALPADEAIARAFACGYAEAHRLERELIDLACLVCRTVDRGSGCFGDLGLDIAIDRAKRLWLFEVNKLPMLELPLYMGDERAYYDAKSGPVLFAARLAGFGRNA